MNEQVHALAHVFGVAALTDAGMKAETAVDITTEYGPAYAGRFAEAKAAWNARPRPALTPPEDR